jgi:hypothetical protein
MDRVLEYWFQRPLLALAIIGICIVLILIRKR